MATAPQVQDPYAEFGGAAQASDPYAEFGGSASKAASDPYAEFSGSATDIANRELAKQGLSVAPPPSGFVTPKKVSRLGVDVPAGQQKNVEGALKDVYSGYAEAPVVASGVKGYPRMAGAVKEYTGTFTHPERYATGVDEARAREHAGAEFITGATEAMTPVMGVGAIAAPVRTAVGIGTGMAASYGAGKVAEAAGGSPETQELAKDVGFFLPSTLAAVSGIRGSIYGAGAKPELGGTDAWGRPITPVKGASMAAFGGRVRAGVAVTPEGRGAGLRVGNTTVGIGSPEVAARAATPDPVAEAASALAQKQLTDTAASRVANGQPPVPPQPQAPPPGPSALTSKHVEALANVVRSLPEEQQPHALLEMSGTLAQWILARGKVVDPVSGKIVIAKSPEEAEKAATDIINSAIANHDKAVADAEKTKAQIGKNGVPKSRQAKTEVSTPVSQPAAQGAGAAATDRGSRADTDFKTRLAKFKAQGMSQDEAIAAERQEAVRSGKALADSLNPGEALDLRQTGSIGDYAIKGADGKLHLVREQNGKPIREGRLNETPDTYEQLASAWKADRADADEVIGNLDPSHRNAIFPAKAKATQAQGVTPERFLRDARDGDIITDASGTQWAVRKYGNSGDIARIEDGRVTGEVYGIGGKASVPTDQAIEIARQHIQNETEPDEANVSVAKTLAERAGSENAPKILEKVEGAEGQGQQQKITEGEPLIPSKESADGKISTQLKQEGLEAKPPVQPPAEAKAHIGKEEPGSGRPILQPSSDPVEAQALATEAAPELAGRIEQATKGLDGVEFARLRPQKKPERVAEKSQDEKEPINTIGDLLAGQIVVDSPAAKDAAVAALKKHFELAEPVDDYFERGKEDKGGYRATSLQVKNSNGSTAEIQVVPRELYSIIEQTHRHYAAARDAELAGDNAKADSQRAIANRLNDQAWEKFQERNRSAAGPTAVSKTATGGSTPSTPANLAKGSRVSFTRNGVTQNGIVKYADERMGIARVAPDGGNGSINVSLKDVQSESPADRARTAIREAGMEDLNAKRGIPAEANAEFHPSKQPVHFFNAPGLGTTFGRPSSELQTAADVLKIVKAKFDEEGKEFPAELQEKLSALQPEDTGILTSEPERNGVASQGVEHGPENLHRPTEVSRRQSRVAGENPERTPLAPEARVSAGSGGGGGVESPADELARLRKQLAEVEARQNSTPSLADEEKAAGFPGPDWETKDFRVERAGAGKYVVRRKDGGKGNYGEATSLTGAASKMRAAQRVADGQQSGPLVIKNLQGQTVKTIPDKPAEDYSNIFSLPPRQPSTREVIVDTAERLGHPTNDAFAEALWRWSNREGVPRDWAESVMREAGYKPHSGFPLTRLSDTPAVTWKKAAIVPTRAGVVAVPIEEEKSTPVSQNASTISEESNAAPRTTPQAENLPSVPKPAGEGRNTPASVSAQGKPAPQEAGNVPENNRGAHAERVEQPSGRAEGGSQPARSGRSSPTEHPATEREGRGANGKPVEAHTPEEPVEARKTQEQLSNQRNFHISDEYAEKIGSGGEIAKIKGNLDALETLKKIQKEGRELATPEEQEALAKYVDFGGLVGMLQNHWKPEYREHYRRYTELLSEAEQQEIRETLPNTHYTSMQMVDWMWKAMQRMGFKGGRILEPGMGIGNFLGRIPEKVSNKSDILGVERNPLTGAMAHLLYPDARIFVKPFQQFVIPNESLDAIIGNVPFQDVDITDDPVYAKLKLNLHNYFIVKSLDKLRPGGVAALITSRYTMDNSTGKGQRAREEMAKRADLVAAIRLPDKAFKGNAGTEVVADLLIFKKRPPGSEPESMPDWTTLAPITVEGEKPIVKQYGMSSYVENQARTQPKEFMVNKYFVDHPENVLGTHSQEGKMYGPGQYTVKASTEEFNSALEKAMDSIPKSIFGKTEAKPAEVAPSTLDPQNLDFAPESVKPGAFFRNDKGQIRIKQSGVGAELPKELKSPDKLLHIGKAIDLRDQLNRTIEVQLESSDDTPLKGEQEKLDKLYEEYRKKYGSLHGPKLKAVFGEDPEYPKLLALENLNPETKELSKASIFSKRVLAPYEPLRELPDNPKAAMLKVMADRGYLDTGLMAKLLDKPEQDVVGKLEREELVYQDPNTGRYHTADEYLSGNVRDKLRLAEQAAHTDSKFQRNVEALKKAQPKALSIHEIQPNLGQTWIPNDVYKGFIKHLAGGLRSDAISITRDATGKWSVKLDYVPNDLTLKWAGGGVPGHKLAEYALNQQQPTVWQKDSEGRRSMNAEATTAAREKLAAIKEEFRTILRRAQQGVIDELEQIYNDTFNSHKLREFNGEHLDFPGMSEEWRKLIRGYQRAAVWRILQEGRAGIFHAPGLGKTLTMIAAGMEARRLKLSRKNLYAVPNHMVGQWREDFKRFYPNANVLAVSDEDFNATNRARLMSRIATGDWDAIIVPHSQFDLLPMSAEWESKTINKRLKDYREVLEDLDEKEDKRTIKQIEKAIDKLESRLNELNSKKKDNTIPFDQLGIDMMFVDEAHAYKAMAVPSRMGNIGGLSNRASQRAFALEMKADFMRETHRGRGLVFATGTPITNTVGELYIMTKYLAPEMLEQAGIRSFDDWAANFATTITQWEYGPDGVTFKPKTTLSEFVNVPELSNMFQRYGEYLSKKDARKLANMKEPEDEHVDHMLKITPAQEPLLDMIAKRGEALTKHPPRTKEERKADNWLKLSGDARKISLDARLYSPRLKDDPGSKANEAVKTIKKELDETAAQKGTVVVFSDFFQHKGADGKTDFNLFEDMRHKLYKMGVPNDQMAIIHDFDSKEAKEELFAKVRSGRIRVLFGSTDKMGIGTNIQDRLYAEHHLDQPWRPDQVEQREGRIVRSGNMWDKVKIHRYIAEPEEGMKKVREIVGYNTDENMKDTPIYEEKEVPRPRAYDLQMYQQLARKAHFQEQFLTGSYTGRNMEDTGGEVRLNSQMFELAKAMATGNPDAMRKVKLEHDLRTYELLERNFQVEYSKKSREAAGLESYAIPSYQADAKRYDQAARIWEHTQELESTKKDGTPLEIDGKTYATKKEREELVKSLTPLDLIGKPLKIGGLDVTLEMRPTREQGKDNKFFDTEGPAYYLAGILHWAPWNFEKQRYEMSGFLSSFANNARQLRKFAERAEEDVRENTTRLASLKEDLKNKSPYIDKVEKMSNELREIDKRLGVKGSGDQDEGADVDEGGEESAAEGGKPVRPGEAQEVNGIPESAKSVEQPRAQMVLKQQKLPPAPERDAPLRTIEKYLASNAVQEHLHQPGSVVAGYAGRWDKVLEFMPNGGMGGGWAVKVVASDKDGNPIPGESPRIHSTPIDWREYKRMQENNQHSVRPGARLANSGNETGQNNLQQLSESIRANTPPNASLRDRLRIGRQVGQSRPYAGAGGGILGEIKGTLAALWDAYKSPPKWTDYEDATGKWSAAEQASALDLYRFTEAVKKAVPSKLKREAISNWIEANGDKAVLRERAEASSGKYKPGYEAALTLTPEEETIARNVMNLHDATAQEAIDAGIMQHAVENYVQHVYSNKPQMLNRVIAEGNFASLNTKPSFTKQRTIPTYFDAEQLGFAPKDKDVGFLTAVHERALREALAARTYIKALKDGKASDGRPLVATSWASAKEMSGDEDRGSAYLIKPNLKPGEEYGDYRRIDHPALRGWKWSTEIDGKPVFVQGDMVVHPEIYQKLKNNLTHSAIRGYAVMIAGKEIHPGALALEAQAQAKHLILSYSGFHQSTLALHGLEHRVNIMDLPDLDLNQPDQKLLVEHGLMVANYDAMEAFGEGVASSGLSTKVPGIGPAYAKYVNYLFKSFMPRLKMKMAQDALARNRERYPQLSEDQVAVMTANQANAAFGGLNYKMLGRNKTMQDFLRLAFMAPDFTEARARFVAQAAKPFGREQLAAYMLGAAVLYTLARVINEMSDKQPHWSKPFSVVVGSKEYGLRTIQGDTINFITDPKRFLLNRFSPAVNAIIKSEDERYKRKHETLADKLKQKAEGQAPIPLQPWLQRSHDTHAQKAAESAMKMVGINVKNAHPAHHH